MDFHEAVTFRTFDPLVLEGHASESMQATEQAIQGTISSRRESNSAFVSVERAPVESK